MAIELASESHKAAVASIERYFRENMEEQIGNVAAAEETLPPVATVVSTLRARGIDLPPGPVRVDGYGDSPELSASLLALIRQGRKRAGTSLLWAVEAEGETLPEVGQIEIVVDHRNEPALITRITQVQVLPYDQVTAEYAAIEGEGDGSLEYWRDAHWAFFTRECQRIGRESSQTMPVVCCVFELLMSVDRKEDGW